MNGVVLDSGNNVITGSITSASVGIVGRRLTNKATVAQVKISELIGESDAEISHPQKAGVKKLKTYIDLFVELVASMKRLEVWALNVSSPLT